jgi:hypothetical protein
MPDSAKCATGAPLPSKFYDCDAITETRLVSVMVVPPVPIILSFAILLERTSCQTRARRTQSKLGIEMA